MRSVYRISSKIQKNHADLLMGVERIRAEIVILFPYEGHMKQFRLVKCACHEDLDSVSQYSYDFV